MKMVRFDVGEGLTKKAPVKDRRSPPLIIFTKMTAHYLNSLMLANGIKAFNVRQNDAAKPDSGESSATVGDEGTIFFTYRQQE